MVLFADVAAFATLAAFYYFVAFVMFVISVFANVSEGVDSFSSSNALGTNNIYKLIASAEIFLGNKIFDNKKHAQMHYFRLSLCVLFFRFL